MRSGAGGNGGHEPIDFVGLAQALLARAHVLVPQWLPNGVERGGRWYCGDFDGGDGESANVNLSTGQWIDNGGSDDDRGGDLISLYARVNGCNNGEAARRLMAELGWARSQAAAPVTPERALAAALGADKPEPEPEAQAVAPRESRWRPIVPVPAGVPRPGFRWSFKDKLTDTWVDLEPVKTWAYEFGGQLFGHVARFERVKSSTGEIVKDTLPRTWCEDTQGERGLAWRWKAWDAPRPLYVPLGTLAQDPSAVPVVVVEGEKCAEAGHVLLGGEFDFVSWPGGCKTWALADWSWLKGRTVYLWPDADAEHERLTKAEREAGVPRTDKPLMPLERQPGYVAMVRIGSVLMAEHGCQVFIVRMRPPGERPHGWDIADAVADGWDAKRVRDYIRGAGVFVPPDDAARARAAVLRGSEPGAADAAAGASPEEAALEWRKYLLTSGTGTTRPVRENVVLALDGITLQDGRYVPGAEDAKGLIAYNAFTNDVVKLRDTPWGTSAGVWEEVDELELGAWLTRAHWLPSMPRGTLEEAVSMVSKRHAFHPVRDELEALRGTWDKQRRLDGWLQRACMAGEVPPEDQKYLARVGTWLVMAICARVLTPGCKFDYMVIFEGAQGVGKSTLAKLLGGQYFADTGLVLGEKDSYQNLQGVLVYEWGELDALSKADVRKVKQFISSEKDRFRASFDRRPRDYPRQVVFIGTTNEDHYLTDGTGNRRFWPVRVNRHIDTAWFKENRAQLFAEALEYLQAGERFHPTPREQKELFDPQQLQRQVEDPIQAAVLRYLYDENQRVSATGENGTLVNEISVPDLLTRVGVLVEKQTTQVIKQAGAALRHAGWERFRSSRGDRPWMFKRPEGQAGKSPLAADDVSNRPTAATQQQQDRDAIPF